MPTNDLNWKPWHKVVTLREDLRSGDLAMNEFAADLHDVAWGTAKPTYQKPEEFFAFTYPTYNLRELVKDVCLCLAGKSDKSVRQLELTYGGGKTHSLVTLYHLFNDPKALPDLSAVREFVQHMGMTPPRSRICVLSFDRLDVEKGMEVKDPDGNKRWLKKPWSVIAFQIAGIEGLKLLNADGKDAERDSAPATNLLIELLSGPVKQGMSVLILIDEVLMYAREKVGHDAAWKSRLENFFQYLTQAVTRVKGTAIVASLLATDPKMSDTLGKEISRGLYSIFKREREEGVQPVLKEDVAEILRRRFFTADSVKDIPSFLPHVVTAMKGVTALDEDTKKEGQAAEQRYLKSFPFHPDLTEVFYSKWTGLEGFQRTRGVLRTYALALRAAEKWDDSPLVGVNVFLASPGNEGIAEAARELTTTTSAEEYEGKKQEWSAILGSELTKSREIQQGYSGLKHRELEQAVFATFLHSQPVGQKALTRELMILLGQTRPDKIELEKALCQWAERSWFLDETEMQDKGNVTGQITEVPKAWRLGAQPNLKQMHSEAYGKIPDDLVQQRLIDEIQKLKTLSNGATAAGAKLHNLPTKPKDIQDDGDFHYAVLGPLASSEAGQVSAEAKKFIDQTTTADRPRVYRNAIVLAVPSKQGIDLARNVIKEHLAWLEVQSQVNKKDMDVIRQQKLLGHVTTTQSAIADRIRQAYCIVVTVSKDDEVHAFKLSLGDDPLFLQIKNDKRSNIEETAINAEALLPGGPYDQYGKYSLWKEGDQSRRVKDLVGAFAQFPHLPKMLNRAAILDTLRQGCMQGLFILRLERPDRSIKTFWREMADDSSLADPGLEIVLLEHATLTELSPSIISSKTLPELWASGTTTYRDLLAYFSGKHVAKVKTQGYEEQIVIPRAETDVVAKAVHGAVQEGRLWLLNGPASVCAEEIPHGVLTPEAVLSLPPAPISARDILSDVLPEAWTEGVSFGNGAHYGLVEEGWTALPWITVRKVIDDAIRGRFIETTEDSVAWPTDYALSGKLKLRRVGTKEIGKEEPKSVTASAKLEINQLQDLAEHIGDISKSAGGYPITLHIKIELGGTQRPPADTVQKVNEKLRQVNEQLELR